MIGFAKKALIADQLSLITDQGIFNQPPSHIPAGTAWLVILSYTLQIYFDFSAYSDMAIGLGQAFGFQFPENFNYPYLSTSLTDFWRRWHITLSGWFREYVFFPLEKKRGTLRWLKQPMNIIIVFLLTGLWHGITPPFIIWGLLHGCVLALERGRFGNWLKNAWLPLQHVYFLLVIIFSWVFFRSPNLAYALGFLKAMFNFFHSAKPLPYSVFPIVSHSTWLALLAGLLFSFPIQSLFEKLVSQKSWAKKNTTWFWAQNLLVLLLFLAGIIMQAGSTYHPFIYRDF